MVAIKHDIVAKLSSRKSHDFDLKTEYFTQTNSGMSRTTIPRHSLLSLREATEELLEEGVDLRRKLMQRRFSDVKSWAKKMKFSFCTEEQYLGYFTLPLYLPSSCNYKKFIEQLRKKGFFVFYSFKGPDGNTFEICVAGYISDREIETFFKVVEEVLQ